MIKKSVIKILGILFIIPGFIFDLCVGFTFIVNDGRADNHAGDFISLWAIDLATNLPIIMKVPFMISVLIGIIPAAAVCIGTIIGLAFMAVYVLNGVIGSIIQIPFTGKLRWITLTSLSE